MVRVGRVELPFTRWQRVVLATGRHQHEMERLRGFEPLPYGLEGRHTAVDTTAAKWNARRDSNPHDLGS